MTYFIKYIYLMLCVGLLSGCAQCSSSGRRSARNEASAEKRVSRVPEPPVSVSVPVPEPVLPSQPPMMSLVNLAAQAEKCVFTVHTVSNGRAIGLGTGFFITSDGIGVSNHHVFVNGTEWYIELSDKRQYWVTEIIKQSVDYDYVVFRINASNVVFPFLNRASTTPLKGEEIAILGNPSGLESTLTKGVVSAIRSANNADDLIQIDAAISPGSSGSPVMNLRGEVVGIATFKRLECENCNFAYNIKRLND